MTKYPGRKANNSRRWPSLHVEGLEERNLLAGNVFQDLADAITDAGAGQMAEVRDQILAAAPDVLVPLVGTPLEKAADLLDEARAALHGALNGLGAGASVDETEAAIEAALGDEPGGLNLLGDYNGDGLITPDDVIIDTLDLDGSLIDIRFRLEKDVALSTPEAVDFDLGLPALPFYVLGASGNVQASFGFHYDEFHFGINNDGAFLDLGAPGDGPDLTFFAEAGLSEDFALEGAIGFIHGSIQASDDPTGLSAQIGIDLTDGAAPTFDVEGTAEINLQLSAEVIGPDFPGVSTVLHVGWSGDDPSDVPEVEFRDISLDFSSRFLEPIVEHLDPLLDAAGSVVEKLHTPVPVLSDLSEGLGLGPVSVMSVIETALNWDALPPDYEAIAEGIVTVADIVGILDAFEPGDEDETFHLNFGSFQVAGDVRTAQPSGDITMVSNDPLSQLQIDPDSFDPSAFDIDWARQQVQSLEALPESLKDSLDQLLDELENGVQMSFPLLDSPGQGVFQLLLGHDVDLFKLEAHFNPVGDYADSFGTPLGVDAGLEGTLEPELDLEFGLDTYGLRTYVSNLFNGAPVAADLLSGFYVGEEAAFRLNAGIDASVGVNALVFHADVSGGVNGNFLIEIPEQVQAAVNGKVRLRSDLSDCLFHIAGGVSGHLTVTVGVGVEIPFGNFLGAEKEWVLASKDLIKFNIDCVPNPWAEHPDPHLATLLGDGTLQLNIGPNSIARSHEPGISDEAYYIVASAPQEGDAPGLAVDVFFEGQRERFHGVTTIYGDAGGGDDSIDVHLGEAGEAVTVAIQGGIGNDTLNVEGGTLIFVSGSQGDDAVDYEGTGTAWLWGGTGDDILRGGDGANSLLGGSGNDELYGGAGDNYLEGEDGHDLLVGGSGTNELQGNNGNDTLIAGPNGDLLYGGNGSDTYLTGAGDDQIFVTGGQQVGSTETISWDYGDGNPLINAPNGLHVILEVLGSPGDDFFRMRDGVVPGTVQIDAPDGRIITGSGLDDVSIDARHGMDHTIIEALDPSQDVDRIAVNLTDNLDNDGAVDLVEVRGSQGDDELVIDQDQVILEAHDGGIDQPENLTWGGVMTVAGMPDYTVFVMNIADDLRVQTFSGEDNVQVHSVTGPTLIDTGNGDDVIDVSAATAGQPGVTFEGPVPPDYAAEVVIEAGAGSNRLTVDEVDNNNPDTFTLADSLITSLLLPGVHYQATGGSYELVALVGTALYDVLQVQSTSVGVSETVVHGWDGDDTFQVALESGSLSGIGGPLRVTAGTGGSSAAILSDRTATFGNADVLFAGDAVTGLAGASDDVPLYFETLGGDLLVALEGSESLAMAEQFTLDAFLQPLLIEGREGDETFIVHTLAAEATLRGEEGNELYTVGDDLGLITATLTIEDASGANVIDVDDSAAAGGRIYELNDSALAVVGSGHDEIVLNGVAGTFNMLATDFSDQFRAWGAPGTLSVNVELAGGSNVLVGPSSATWWDISAENEVTVDGNGSFQQANHLIGGSAGDWFAFGAAGRVTGHLIAGAGNDTLDYSALAVPVTVDLAAGIASGVGGVVLQVENVIGGNGDDVLFGDDGRNRLHGNGGNDLILGRGGKDLLFGDVGRDLLIGGLGSDRVFGGWGEDLLIGGTTTHDNDFDILMEVFSVWKNEDLDYATRVRSLRSGSLTGATVLDDGQPDILRGQRHLDWFWAFFGDKLGRTKGERVN